MDFITIVAQHLSLLRDMREWQTDWLETFCCTPCGKHRGFFQFVDQLLTSSFGFRVGSNREKLFFALAWRHIFVSPLFHQTYEVTLSG